MDVSNEDTSGETSQRSSVSRKGQIVSPLSVNHSQRTRLTMVCGECKRLKLKCDREQPCQQCTKRNCTEKCQYSPGASKKQDIHTVSTRLAEMEAFMVASTNGRFRPACSSANQPSSQTSATVSSQYAGRSSQQHPTVHVHQHHHHTATLNCDPSLGLVSKSFKSIVPACLKDLQIFRPQTSSLPVNKQQYFTLTTTISPSIHISKSQLSQRLRRYRERVEADIPPMALYLPVQVSAFESQQHLEDNMLRATPAIFLKLPRLGTCRLLLESAEAAFFLRRLPFDPSYGSEQVWKKFQTKCLEFLSNAGNKTKENETSLNKGHDLHSAGASQPLVDEASMLDIDGSRENRQKEQDGVRGSSLTFFAMTCATLAIGAIHSLTPYNAELLYTLSQQALGMWDTHNFSSSSKCSSIKDDREHMEYLFACLLGVVYLLQSGTVAAASSDERADYDDDGEHVDLVVVTTLVRKMVACAQNMHLDKDTTWTKRKRTTSSNKDRLHDEWKRMIWWEIVFYDLFLADALGQQPKISLVPHSTNLPSCAIFASLEQPEDNPQNHNVQSALSPDDQAAKTWMDIEAAYFGARYQLTRVAHTVKSRSQPDCCCGYTLDQAVALENQVWEWQNALPPFLKVSQEDGRKPLLFTGVHFDYVLTQMWAHELTIVSHVLVANLYMPFLCPDGSDNNKPRFNNIPATLACIHAAQAILRLIHGLQRLASFSPGSTSSKAMLPVMFDFLSLHKLLFNSVVICGHATFQGISQSMPFSMGAVADDLSLGLEVLTDFEIKSLGSSILPSVVHCDDDSRFQASVSRMLIKRLNQRHIDMAAKRTLGSTTDSSIDFHRPVSDAHHVMDYQQLHVSQDGSPPRHTFSFSSPSSTLESDHSGTCSSNPQNSSHSKLKSHDLVEDNNAKVGTRKREKNSDCPSPPPLSAERLQQRIQAMGQIPLTQPRSTNTHTLSSFNALPALEHRSHSLSTGQVYSRQVESLQFKPQLSNELDMPPRKRPVLRDIRERRLQPRSTPFIPQTFNQRAQDTKDLDSNNL